MNTIFAFILVIGLLIFVHELGHFLFAKLFGVRVLKFSLGFGPKLFGKTVGETEYVVSALPLGGYVKMFGENPDEQKVSAAEKSVAFAHKSVMQRFFIIFAGPLFNLLFPVILLFFLFLAIGVPEQIESTRIGKVMEDSPAMEAGLQKGDEIIVINNRVIEKWRDVVDTIGDSGGREVSLTALRDGEQVKVRLQPKYEEVEKNIFGEKEERLVVGIVKDMDFQYVPVGVVQAFGAACSQTWSFIYLTGMGFVKIIQQVIPASELGGPILIAQMAGQQLRAGWVDLMYFIGILSVNLGILNLLPIPILDGGHLAFLTVEAIRRKPMGEKAQIVAQQIGLAFLCTLMVFVFYNDILRVFE